MKRIFFLPLICFIITGCNNQKKQIPVKLFSYVEIPFYINSIEESYKYAALNYWDSFADSAKVYSKDTIYLGGVSKSSFDKALSEYLQLISNIPTNIAFQAQEKTCSIFTNILKENKSSKIWDYYFDKTSSILYDVSSNFRNEELYLPVLKTAIKLSLDSNKIESYKTDLKDVSKNRIGEKATNFKYCTKNGNIQTLFSIKKDYTLVFFSNPECSSCKKTISYLSNSEIINSLISSDKLCFINLYIDENLNYWFKYMSIYPQNWINAYNPNQVIKLNNLYNIRAIPTIYLLDKEKRVIMKDAIPASINNYLNHLSK